MTSGPVPARTPELSAAFLDDLHETYRHLHRTPELSMQEHETAATIEHRLVSLGIEHFRCGSTGVVGILTHSEPGPVVAYRADIDALPLAEDTGLEYASHATGVLPDGTPVPVMHACGHDAHTAIALGLAELFSSRRDLWSGTIVFIFQPGEETAAGAKAMVEDGLWSRVPRPEVLLGQHVGPAPAGTVVYAEGTAMAFADSIFVTVRGRGAHASRPAEAIDPILLAAHMIVRLQGIVSREVAPQRSAVVTVGQIHGGLKENIIPSTVEFTVNVRSFEPEVRERVLAAITRILNAEAAASGAEAPLLRTAYSFPQCFNDPASTRRAIGAIRAELGEGQLRESEPFMGSEDVGNLSEAIGCPLVYWLCGGHPHEAPANGQSHPGNHSAGFALVLEPTLSTGVRAGAAALLAWLGRR